MLYMAVAPAFITGLIEPKYCFTKASDCDLSQGDWSPSVYRLDIQSNTLRNQYQCSTLQSAGCSFVWQSILQVTSSYYKT